MPGQGRLGDKANVPLDAHGCPACPHPAIGPAIIGSPDVQVNKRPALRVGDTGIHAACCGTNTWEAKTGAPTVFINGKAAHRQGDQNKHCGGMGQLVEGSPNVMTGSDMTPGAGAAGGADSSAGSRGSDAGGGTAQGSAPAGSAATNGDGSPSNSASSGGSPGNSASNRASPGASSGASPNTDALTSDQIQVTLVSPKGDPQPAISFTLTLPSGAVKAGATSADGALRFSGLTESGTCKLVLDGIPSDPTATSAASRVRYVPDGVSVPIGKASVVEVPPHAYRGRLVGLHFETSKCFLLPTSMTGVQGLVDYYDDHPGAEVLVVGHTDTAGTDAYNLTLSVERAEAIAAYLREDAAAWMTWFAVGKPAEKRWSTREVQHMLRALPDSEDPFFIGLVDGKDGPEIRHAVGEFQTWSNATRGTALPTDGIASDPTRTELVRAYMAFEGTSLPASTPIQIHGGGPYHPEVATGPGVDEPRNRRAEVFLFVGGIDPPPRACAAPGCAEYPQWLAAVVETIDLEAGTAIGASLALEIAIADEGDASALIVEDGGGATVLELAAAKARRRNGSLVFSLHPADLPNPMTLRRRGATPDALAFVGGPCNPFALRDALRRAQVGEADALLGTAPAPPPAPEPPPGDHFDDGHL